MTYSIPKGIVCGVYRIIHSDGHYYLGSTKNLYERYQTHLRELRQGSHHNVHMQRKYNLDPEGWSFTLMAETNEQIALEAKLLKEHYGQPLCMNCSEFANRPPDTTGIPKTPLHNLHNSRARLGYRHRQESKDKMKGWKRPKSSEWRQTHAEKLRNRPRSDETKHRISQALTGIKRSDETKAKIGLTSRRPCSPATREKIRLSMLSRNKLNNLIPAISQKIVVKPFD